MKVFTNISVNNWSSFVRSHPEGTIFQMPEMFELFLKSEKFEPLVLGVYNGEEKLCGILLGVYIHEKKGPGKLLSSRFVVYGGPLLIGEKDQQAESLDLLLKELVAQTKNKALFIQFRNFFNWKDHLQVFEKNGFSFLERLNYIIQVPGPSSSLRTGAGDRVQGGLKNMSKGRRRQIEKALKSSAVIIEPENIEQFREFYDILYKLYRYKVRKPLPDWSFFENFYKQTIPRPGIGIIRLIRYQDRIIGGILAPVFGQKCIYEWYVCGLDKEYREQYPSVLATWAALEYAISNNIETFDFMGVGKPEVPYGVRDFKARFGGELVNYGRMTRINNRFLYNIAELGYNILALLKKI